ncbi:hypothetical protein CGRA01v4_09753 [Colletotrichum graminicola]|nr:hypothetical protein CGRA01v4_09753 [Colletotrichum graminicola]
MCFSITCSQGSVPGTRTSRRRSADKNEPGHVFLLHPPFPPERSRFVSGTPMGSKLGASHPRHSLHPVRTCAAPKRL